MSLRWPYDSRLPLPATCLTWLIGDAGLHDQTCRLNSFCGMVLQSPVSVSQITQQCCYRPFRLNPFAKLIVQTKTIASQILRKLPEVIIGLQQLLLCHFRSRYWPGGNLRFSTIRRLPGIQLRIFTCGNAAKMGCQLFDPFSPVGPKGKQATYSRCRHRQGNSDNITDDSSGEFSKIHGLTRNDYVTHFGIVRGEGEPFVNQMEISVKKISMNRQLQTNYRNKLIHKMEMLSDFADTDRKGPVFRLPDLPEDDESRPAQLVALEQAAAEGDADAQHAIGQIYRTGKEITQNYAEAMRWFLKAFENQNADAGYALGTMYLRGQGTDKDTTAAIKWYRAAASRNQADAMNALGNIYAMGNGAPKDMVMAAKWFRLAAKNGHGNAQLVYALMLRDGRGGDKDPEAARKWAAKATESLAGTEKEAVARKVYEELNQGGRGNRSVQPSRRSSNAA